MTKRSTWQRSKAYPGLGAVALAYVAVDYLRDNAKWMHPALSENIQLGMWGIFVIFAVCEIPSYRYWRAEIKAIPKFISCLLFMILTLTLEVIMVTFVTVVLGKDWHREADPLPDTGQWILLALNERIHPSLLPLLRMRLIELHHFLMLFVLLGFSVLFNCVRPPGLGLAARYCFTMAVGRFLRMLSFSSTILPSPRPWCALNRFLGLPPHPHPIAQRYYSPYSRNHSMIQHLLDLDMCFVPDVAYPNEYIPNWGILQFLVPLLRPTDPSYFQSRNIKNDKLFGVVRPGGGCNDLVFSGHVIVAALTACAWQEAHPGWASKIIWLLVLHSGQREIRERHHYSVDVILGIVVSILLWRSTKFIWSGVGTTRRNLCRLFVDNRDRLLKHAKDGDLDNVRKILDEIDASSKDDVDNNNFVNDFSLSYVGIAIVLVCVFLSIALFFLMVGG